MELISIDELKHFLQSNKFDLNATQSKLCFPIIQRIYYKMTLGIDFENINVDNSSIINGHHRYICSLLSKKTIKINPWSSPSEISQYEWADVEVDENDWESISTIKEHNSKDAQRTGCKVEVFNILLER